MTLLTDIIATKYLEIAAAKRLVHEPVLRETLALAPTPRGFFAALQQKAEAGEPALICEMKQRSPSLGQLLDDYQPAALAAAYEAGGAACLSVLTDGPYFGGQLAHVLQAREACTLPVLRKDFIVDSYQIAEARAWGADCILLIMACLETAKAQDLCHCAMDMGMDVLAEVHDEAELEAALTLPTRLLGINNRNLATLETDIAVTERLAPLVPDGFFLVSESGIRSASEVRRLKAVGAKGFLVGHSLLKQAGSLRAATETLRGADNV